MMKVSCELPKMLPFLALTPTMRNWSPAIVTCLSIGLISPNISSATSQPSIATGWLRSTSARTHDPAEFGVEHREIEVLAA